MDNFDRNKLESNAKVALQRCSATKTTKMG